eukprot:TRINITY_DN8868_c2_g1_i1.p1 TRINITY_DN8868_c2_g1~~TRINITY_DN8868_c2_g1_i1.p1  ORF type:complete len:936 (+),score=197.51 TRINITY_DN8868_c2_g1_i1:97-2904(+)
MRRFVLLCAAPALCAAQAVHTQSDPASCSLSDLSFLTPTASEIVNRYTRLDIVLSVSSAGCPQPQVAVRCGLNDTAEPCVYAGPVGSGAQVNCRATFRSSALKHCDGDAEVYAYWDPAGANSTMRIRLNGKTAAEIYVGVSAVSIVASVCGLGLMMRRGMWRWPATLAVFRTLSHMMLAVVVLVQSMYLLINDETLCNRAVIFATQFSLWSATGWYLCISISFYKSVADPFKRPQSLAPVYHTLVWLAALGTAAGAASQGGKYHSDFQLCWLSSNRPDISSTDWGLFWAWLGVCLLGSWILIALTMLKLRQSYVRQTLGPRREGLKQMQVWTTAFAVHWGIIAFLWHLSWAMERRQQSDWAGSGRQDVMIQKEGWAETFAAVFSALGLVDGLSWVVVLARRRIVLTRQFDGHGRVALRTSPIESTQPTHDIRNGTPLLVVADLGEWTKVALIPEEGDATFLEGFVKTHNLVTSWEEPSPAASSKADVDGHEECLRETWNEDMLQPYLPCDDLSDALRNEFILAITAGIRSVNSKGLGKTALDTRVIDMTELRRESQIKMQEGVLTKGDEYRGEMESRVDGFEQSSGRSSNFVSYAPRVFQTLRKHWGVHLDSYTESVDGKSRSFHKRNFSEGRSGGFFFFSNDRRLMFKTICAQEHRALLSMLAGYCAHMLQHESVICRFYGCYSLQLYGQTQYVVVMGNVLRTAPGDQLSTVYDLKGSRHGRNGLPAEPGRRKGTLKDNDLHTPLYLSADEVRALNSAVERDTRFLADNGIMDYSLLVGVVDIVVPSAGRCASAGLRSAPPSPTPSGGDDGWQGHTCNYPAEVVIGPGHYYIGIIDILQKWNLWKKCDRLYKMFVQGHVFSLPRRKAKRTRRAWLDHPGSSCVTPGYYRYRFSRMVKNIVSSDCYATRTFDAGAAALEEHESFDCAEYAGYAAD